MDVIGGFPPTAMSVKYLTARQGNAQETRKHRTALKKRDSVTSRWIQSLEVEGNLME